MQTVSGSLSVGPTRLDMAIVFGPAFTILGEAREGMTFDSRFIVPLKGKCVEATHLYILLEGSFQWLGGPRFEAPSAFLAPARFFDGENGVLVATYRAGGPRFRAVEVRVGKDVFGERSLEGPEPVTLSDAVMLNGSDFLSAPSDEERKSLAQELLTRLRADGVFAHELTPRSLAEEVIESAVWGALVPVLREWSLSTPTTQIASTYGATSRRLHAVLSRSAPALFFGFTSWRDFARRYRLKLAVLLLSRDDLSVKAIALAAGYASAEALTHAFYAERLPAPREVRAAIRYAAERKDRITLPVPKP